MDFCKNKRKRINVCFAGACVKYALSRLGSDIFGTEMILYIWTNVIGLKYIREIDFIYRTHLSGKN